jgi:hypothetical protein
MTVHTSEHTTTKTKTSRDGVSVALSAEQLEQAGIHPGEEMLLEVRRYTAEDWIRDNEGHIYHSEEEFDTAMNEFLALPES